MEKTNIAKPLTDKELRILQLTELDIMLEFDRICRKNDIKYYIIGGTLLGAVRHKGFIPWDDDADIAMLRADYERFLQVCENDLDKEKYYYHDRFRTEGYRWGFGKLRKKNTTFVRPTTEDMPYEQGVYIDLMPLDYVPNSTMGQLVCDWIAFFFRKAAWAKVGKKTTKNILCRGCYYLLDAIPFSVQNKLFKKFVQRLNRKPTKYVRILGVYIAKAKGEKGCWRYKTEWLNNMRDYEFEGYLLEGFADAQQALRRTYGDYLKPVRFPALTFSECVLPPLDEIKVRDELKEKLL